MGLLNRLDNPYDISPGIVLGTMEDLLNWGRARSDWYLQFGLACCAIEFMALNASHYDLMRFGCIPRTSPRQADFIIISGTVTLKMAERIKRLYEQMAEPKYVLAMGSCSICGGPYWKEGYHVLKGVDRIIPVDVYVPGCPPRPEAFFDGMIKLQEKINKQKIFEKRARIAEEDAKNGNSSNIHLPHGWEEVK
ncbi:MAG: NADH-quinone oxidoreductase subunit B [Ignavibacteria bacterium]|nr:NADH-quinone oxidoreductase subunit B [Ignavibacteria bacterium]